MNRFYFLKVLQAVQFLGKQGLPVRGHTDEELDAAFKSSSQ